MGDPELNPYDEVPYPGQVHAQTHPDRMAVAATLCGMESAPPERCRMLELGCGDGTNLLSAALVAPGSEFVGVDLAGRPIAEGREAAGELGLRNVTLHRASIAELPPDLGTFDYIAAHGVYSWVPAAVRDALLAACRVHLAPQGVAYVSYSVYPGAHLSDMLRGMMLLHVREIRDPRERVRQAIALTRFLAAGQAETPDLWRQVLRQELDRFLDHGEGQIRHDKLGEENQPVWWFQFADHARRHGLAYLAEADWFEMQDHGFVPGVREALARMGSDRVTREQYLDFLKCRRFRQTLLVRREVALDLAPRPERVRRFHVACAARPPEGGPALNVRAVERFEGPSGGAVETDAPVARAALRELGEAWPQGFAFDDLLARAHGRVAAAGGPATPAAEEDTRLLADTLSWVHEAGLVRFHLQPSACVLEPGERPTSSLLARWQARRGDVVASLVHDNVVLEDGLVRRLRVVRAFPDPELGLEGFTFETADGEVGAVHLDNVLVHNADPHAELERTLYRLALAAEDALAESGMSKRAVARRLGTSMSQLARLLDATNHAKSVEQMMALLRVLGRDVEVVVRRRKPVTAA